LQSWRHRGKAGALAPLRTFCGAGPPPLLKLRGSEALV